MVNDPRLPLAIDQIRSTRAYAVEMIETIELADWFRTPHEGVTHVAWQVGHLAVAEFRLALWRVRGPRNGDDEIMPPPFVKAFGHESVPASQSETPFSAGEIRRVLDCVHEQVMTELPALPDSILDEPATPPPPPFYTTKLDALLWCARHEMIHVGQLGLLRRLFGQSPTW